MLFRSQILDEFGWDRGVTAGAFSFGFLVSALVTPCVGWLTDRRGPRLVIETGVFLMGTGLLLATLIREPWQLYLPSRPGDLHPEPLTDPDLILSHHPARATLRRLPPSVACQVPPVAG